MPVADMVSESFLLRCLLEKGIFEFLEKNSGGNGPVVLKPQESDIPASFVPASRAENHQRERGSDSIQPLFPFKRAILI